jgi:hypothetical protein
VPAGASGAALIKLPEGAEWPQLGAEPLFVRPFYAGCVDGPLSGLDPTGSAPLRKLAVIGNTGSECTSDCEIAARSGMLHARLTSRIAL